MSKRVYLTKEELLRRLVLQTPAEIAGHEGINCQTVQKWIKKYKIKGHIEKRNFHSTLTKKRLEELANECPIIRRKEDLKKYSAFYVTRVDGSRYVAVKVMVTIHISYYTKGRGMEDIMLVR